MGGWGKGQAPGEGEGEDEGEGEAEGEAEAEAEAGRDGVEHLEVEEGCHLLAAQCCDPLFESHLPRVQLQGAYRAHLVEVRVRARARASYPKP